MTTLNKKLLAEFLGTAIFLTSIVGASASGTAFRQAALAVTLGLVILILGPVSGGHFNPVMSVYFYATKQIGLSSLLLYILAQLAGGFVGAWMGISIWGGHLTYGGQASTNLVPALGGEVIATAGLVTIIGYLLNSNRANLIWVAVMAWVFAAGTFTQTGAQANPAVSFAIIFAGHSFGDQALTVVAQFVGLLIAVALLLIISDGSKSAKKAK